MATEKSLASMSASERLAFYRSAVKAIKAPVPAISIAERAAILAAGAANFGTSFTAAYRFHRVQ